MQPVVDPPRISLSNHTVPVRSVPGSYVDSETGDQEQRCRLMLFVESHGDVIQVEVALRSSVNLGWCVGFFTNLRVLRASAADWLEERWLDVYYVD